MARKPLSAQRKFETSIILSAEYMSNPSVNGYCEFAIRRTRSHVELWNWEDEWGGECVVKLSPDSTWRDVVVAMIQNDTCSASINPQSVNVRGISKSVGQILSLAWSSEDSDHTAAEIFSRIDEPSLDRLAKTRQGLFDSSLAGALGELVKTLRERDFEFSDLPQLIELKEPTAKSLTHDVLSIADDLIEKAEAARQERETALQPFLAYITAFIDSWIKDHPYTRYPGGGRVPPVGLHLLKNYLEDYVVAHKHVPVGIHIIAGGKDSLGRTVQPFEISFPPSELSSDGAGSC